MNTSSFDLRLEVVFNTRTGEGFFLQSPEDLGDNLRLALDEFDFGLDLRREAGEDALVLDTARCDFLRRQKVIRKRLLAELDALRPIAKVYEFTLTKPTHGEESRIGVQACTGGQWNEMRYRQLLMESGCVSRNGKVITLAEIAALPRIVGGELGRRLSHTVAVEQRRIMLAIPDTACMKA